MDKLEIIVKALDDKLAKDIVVIDMQLASPVLILLLFVQQIMNV